MPGAGPSASTQRGRVAQRRQLGLQPLLALDRWCRTASHPIRQAGHRALARGQLDEPFGGRDIAMLVDPGQFPTQEVGGVGAPVPPAVAVELAPGAFQAGQQGPDLDLLRGQRRLRDGDAGPLGAQRCGRPSTTGRRRQKCGDRDRALVHGVVVLHGMGRRVVAGKG